MKEQQITELLFNVVDHPAYTHARVAISILRDIQAVIELYEEMNASPDRIIKAIETEIEWNVNFWHNYHIKRWEEDNGKTTSDND